MYRYFVGTLESSGFKHLQLEKIYNILYQSTVFLLI